MVSSFKKKGTACLPTQLRRGQAATAYEGVYTALPAWHYGPRAEHVHRSCPSEEQRQARFCGTVFLFTLALKGRALKDAAIHIESLCYLFMVARAGRCRAAGITATTSSRTG